MMYGALVLVMAAVGLAWLACRRPRPRRWLLPRRVVPRPLVAAVDRQHRHLLAGGMLGETACERTKSHFRELLTAGRDDLVSREFRPGLDFAVRVRALAELGTPEGARILERLLRTSLTGDRGEQSWYWVDVASALRRLGRTEALPAVLRCAAAAAGSAQGDLLAIEAVTFANFAAALRHPTTAVGDRARAALVTAARAARRGGTEIAALVRAGLGDRLAEVTDRTSARSADPWATAAVIEAERLARRLGHWARVLPPDARARAGAQAARLVAANELRRVWLGGASGRLLDRFPHASADEQVAALRCLNDLRADVAPLFPHPPNRRAAWWGDAIRALRWSRSAVVGPALAGQAVRLARAARHRGRAVIALTALKGHPCYEAEQALLQSATAAHPALRAAAVGSLLWAGGRRSPRAASCAPSEPPAPTRTPAPAARPCTRWRDWGSARPLRRWPPGW
ncbi:hypothetical protein R5W23_001015 [Gemmata sp. JC673]|uniref:HEAT repeat domain-containing protein n=1 Tax=Gemmata algarum TaxID=2975278 RepID=A0ABU5F163_9BACT|nr:hypothetical protein [Gemmata algarum]MDY3559843.1 hypothetical protein [Gemmata algarum]